MAYYRINGGKRLEGAVTISGAKNAALAIIPAVILSGESCLLENLPEIEDVRIVEEILTSMGADISRTPDGSMRIDPSGISTFSVTGEMVSSMRASYYLLGALLGRYKKAEIALPGGCAIGQRPIDQHIKGMRALGADIVIQGGSVKARADRLRGAEIYLDVVSVGATINIMLAAVAAVLGIQQVDRMERGAGAREEVHDEGVGLVGNEEAEGILNGIQGFRIVKPFTYHSIEYVCAVSFSIMCFHVPHAFWRRYSFVSVLGNHRTVRISTGNDRFTCLNVSNRARR